VRLPARLGGLARIFRKSAACSGCRSAAQRIRDRTAVRRSCLLPGRHGHDSQARFWRCDVIGRCAACCGQLLAATPSYMAP
jgi:hypothetical protein